MVIHWELYLKAVKDRAESGHTSSYRCLLCDVTLKNPHFAEIHMRRVHGEGGREVMCTYCGKGFATLYSAHKHEKQYHAGNQQGGGNSIGLFCPKNGTNIDPKCHFKKISPKIDQKRPKLYTSQRHSMILTLDLSRNYCYLSLN